MTVEAPPRVDEAEEEHERPRLTWRDVAFWILFAAYTIGGLLVLAQGIGAVWAHLSPDLHSDLHVRGLGVGYMARAALRMADAAHNLPTLPSIVIGYAFSFFNIALATLLLWLRPRDRTARLLAIGLVGTSGVFNLAAQSTYEMLPLLPWESFAQAAAHITAGLSYALALVTFPDGKLVPRWRAAPLVALYLPVMALLGLLTYRAQGLARPAALLIFFGLAVPAAGVAAQGYRFRRAQTSAEYVQARLLFWSLVPAIVIGVYFVVTQGFGDITAPVQLAGRHLPEQPTTVLRIFMPVFLLVPSAVFAGLVRYRLWDIDRVINRTVVYGLVTGLSLGLYFGLVILLQRLLHPFTSGNDFAVAASTIAAMAAFIPLRRRVQDIVDRRFYRQRYNAQRTIEEFSSRLRNELDLEALGIELRGATLRTMQPSHLTLLLKGNGGTMQWQWTYRGRPRD